jgi:hypothetical protein
MKNTSRLGEEQRLTIFSTPEPTTVDLGGRRPWRMVLIVKSMQVKLIIDLINTLSIGRFHEGSDVVPDVDLRPFDAEKLGVSRQHVFIKLEGDNLVVIDNKSSNGTVQSANARTIPSTAAWRRTCVGGIGASGRAAQQSPGLIAFSTRACQIAIPTWQC